MGVIPLSWVNGHGHVHHNEPLRAMPHINVCRAHGLPAPPSGERTDGRERLSAGDLPEGGTTSDRIPNAAVPADRRTVTGAAADPPRGCQGSQPGRSMGSAAGPRGARPCAECRGKQARPPGFARLVQSADSHRPRTTVGDDAHSTRRRADAERNDEAEQHPGRAGRPAAASAQAVLAATDVSVPSPRGSRLRIRCGNRSARLAPGIPSSGAAPRPRLPPGASAGRSRGVPLAAVVSGHRPAAVRSTSPGSSGRSHGRRVPRRLRHPAAGVLQGPARRSR